MRMIAALIVTAVTTGVHAAERVPYRFYAAQRVAPAPKIDGNLDDRAWHGLEVTDRFTRVITAHGLAEAQTWCRMGYDARWLYVAMRCDEPRMPEATQVMHSGSGAFAESVEVFIDTNLDRRTYQQYRVAIDGQTEYRLGYGTAKPGMTWRAAVARGPYAWTVEIAISWELIGLAPKPGLRVGFNLNRCRANVSPMELGCWSNTGGGFHAPMRFGDLVLGDYAGWIKRYAADRIGALRREVKALVAKYPKSTRTLRAQADAVAAVLADAVRHAEVARDEASALTVLEIVNREIALAEAVHNRVRLAVIDGEFR